MSAKTEAVLKAIALGYLVDARVLGYWEDILEGHRSLRRCMIFP